MLTVLDNVPQFLSALDKAHKAVGFARVVALTRTARASAGFLSDETRRVFDRPTRYTVEGFWWRPATADRTSFEVGVKDFGVVTAAKFLRAQIFGGERRQKRSEVAMGRLMGNSGFWVPGPGVKLDQHGNVPGGTIRRILSDLQVSGDQNRTARSRRRNKRYREERYFVPHPRSGLAPGVWVERPPGSRQIAPALLFVAGARYERRFDFFGRGMGFAEARFPIELAQAMREGWHLPRALQKSLGLAPSRRI